MTAAPDRLTLLRQWGVTRISIGVQSFLAPETSAVARPQQPAVVHSEFGHVGEPDDDFLARQQVTDAGLEDIRTFLVEQKCAVPLLHRVVIQLECPVTFVNFADDERPVDDGLEPADRRRFIEREHVNGLDRRRLTV